MDPNNFKKDLSIRHIPRIGRPLGTQLLPPPLTTFKVMLFRLDGFFEMGVGTLPDAQGVLDNLIAEGHNKECLKIIISGPETWIEHNP